MTIRPHPGLSSVTATEGATVPTTHHLDLPSARITYDVREPEVDDGRPTLLMIGQPMCADGFAALADRLPERRIVTYDPRGLGRSTRTERETTHEPMLQADDLHRLVGTLAAPVELFASSGGAVTALAWVAAHPEDVSVLVAHEPPLIRMLDDADSAFAAEAAVQAAYADHGWGAGMAAFIAMTSWTGPFTEEYAARPLPEAAAYGMPSEDDGTRTDPLLSGASDPVTAFRPDIEALRAVTTRLVIAAGEQSAGTLTGRTATALAEALGLPVTAFPSHHGGFTDPSHGGDPAAFAPRLREVLTF